MALLVTVASGCADFALPDLPEGAQELAFEELVSDSFVVPLPMVDTLP